MVTDLHSGVRVVRIELEMVVGCRLKDCFPAGFVVTDIQRFEIIDAQNDVSGRSDF